MKKHILIFVFFFLAMSSFSQNFRSINSTATHYFEDSESNIKIIQIDSVVVDGEDQHYYNYPTFAEGDEPYCYTQYGPSWIGRKMTEVINGDNIFYNLEDEAIIIKTLCVLGDEWICYEFASGNYITASFIEIESMEFLGISDMVKKITFQAKDTNGSSISHAVNNMYLLLSENHGLIRTINFKLFPDSFDEVWYNEICHEYSLSGIEGNEAGVQNLTKEQIFNMEIGDEYHTEEYSYMMGMSTDLKLMISTIISKETSVGNDTLFYQAKRCGKREYQYDTIFTIYYIQDTVDLIYNLQSYSYFDTIPENIIMDGDDDYREYSYNTQWRLYNTEKMVKENWFGFHSSFPHDCIEMIITETKNPGLEQFYWVEGLAGPYWNHEDIYWESYRKLLYYKTATEEWGEPLNCDSLMVNIKKPIVNKQKVFFVPNPMTENSEIKFENPNSEKCTLTLFNLFGKPVKKITHSGNEISMNKESLAAGMYLYSLIIGNREVHSGKLMVQ